MALKKKRGYSSARGSVLANKKKRSARSVPLKKKSSTKKQASPEKTDIYERTRWKKERREYWQNRFRKVLTSGSSKSKAKK
ncbi:MAG: hypothetical protein ACE5J1_02960 [Nitrospiria bacterium]